MAKIDVHHHIYPPLMTKVIEENGGDPSGWFVPPWEISADKAFSNSVGIRTTIFSVTAPGPTILSEPNASAALARSLNEYCAVLRDQDPSSYGFFASVPSLHNTDLAIAEIRYAFDSLHADGITLFTRYGSENTFLGHPDFIPVWEELNARRAVVFVHPTSLENKRLWNPHLPQPLFDYPHETGRTAIDLIVNNRVKQFRDCKIILSHAGGTLPWLAARASMVTATPFAKGVDKTADEIIDEAKSFYFDLALSGSEVVLPGILTFAKPGHVLFGSDYPNAPEVTIRNFTKFIEDYDGMTEEKRQEIWNGAAEKLFPRLKGFNRA